MLQNTNKEPHLYINIINASEVNIKLVPIAYRYIESVFYRKRHPR